MEAGLWSVEARCTSSQKVTRTHHWQVRKPQRHGDMYTDTQPAYTRRSPAQERFDIKLLETCATLAAVCQHHTCFRWLVVEVAHWQIDFLQVAVLVLCISGISGSPLLETGGAPGEVGRLRLVVALGGACCDTSPAHVISPGLSHLANSITRLDSLGCGRWGIRMSSWDDRIQAPPSAATRGN